MSSRTARSGAPMRPVALMRGITVKQTGGSGRLAPHAAFLHEGVHPGAAPLGQDAQPSLDDGPVLHQHGDHVRHGAQGRQIGVLLQHPGGVAPLQGHHQLQGHARAGEVLIGAVVVLLVGVHHGAGLGDALLGGGGGR